MLRTKFQRVLTTTACALDLCFTLSPSPLVSHLSDCQKSKVRNLIQKESEIFIYTELTKTILRNSDAIGYGVIIPYYHSNACLNSQFSTSVPSSSGVGSLTSFLSSVSLF